MNRHLPIHIQRRRVITYIVRIMSEVKNRLKKRILITSSRYFPNIGGVENSLYFLAMAFIEKGYEVDLVCSDVVEGEHI